MKDSEKMTYPQQCAYNVFYNKIVNPKMLRPLRKSLMYSSVAVVLIANIAWIFWIGFWVSCAGMVVWIILLCFIYKKLLRKVWRVADNLFNREIKNSLFWQNYYFSSVIRLYENMKAEEVRIRATLEPIPNVGEPGILNIILQDSKAAAYLFNKANGAHLAVFKYTFKKAEADYKKIMQYLSENNLTLPLVT